MLVFTRKVGQKIVLPSCEAVITVTAIRGNQVNLGIAAPPHVRVNREEVAQRLRAEVAELLAAGAVPEPVG